MTATADHRFRLCQKIIRDLKKYQIVFSSKLTCLSDDAILLPGKRQESEGHEMPQVPG